MVAAILLTRWKIFKSSTNKNLVKHTRHHATRIKVYHRAVVVEFGIGNWGQMKRHCHYIRPNIGIITNVGTAHIGSFGGTVEGVARAKSELIKYMHPRGSLLLNGDDPNSSLLPMHGFQGQIIKIGIENAAVDYRAVEIKPLKQGMAFKVMLKNEKYSFFTPAAGVHNVYNALLAIAVSDQLGFPPHLIQKGLASHLRPRRRLKFHRLSHNVQLIDDSYSSNPHALKAALDVLDQSGSGTRVAILGDMLSLGKYAVSGHTEAGRYVSERNINLLITCGQRARLIGTAAIEAGFPSAQVRHFESRALLHKFLAGTIKANAVILVKASHKANLSPTADFIKRHFR